MAKYIQTKNGKIVLPAFLPDATLGVVRSVDSIDLEKCGIEAVVMNTLHLMQRPGSSTVKALGGLNNMCGWKFPIVTDSGGFQAYSMIRQNSKYGKLTNNGITFIPENANRKYQLTPEKMIQLQISYGSDIIFCLDDCTHVADSLSEQKLSVQRTIEWAGRCKKEFLKIVDQKKLSSENIPLLFGIIQGGAELELRKRCVNELLDIEFDGFGFGGYPLDSNGNLITDILGYTREWVPRKIPMHGLGIGHPENILKCFKMGYELFDCSLPTRDARNGRLYAFNVDPFSSLLNGQWVSYIYIQDKKYIKTNKPVSHFCDCLCCTKYSLGYLHHLFKIKDGSYYRLATIHNLRFMTQLIRNIRQYFSKCGDNSE